MRYRLWQVLQRICRFRLKSLFLVLTLLCLFLGLYFVSFLQQKRSAELLRANDVLVHYGVQRFETMRKLVRTFGPDAFLVADHVYACDRDSLDDGGLISLKGMRRVNALTFVNTRVTTNVLSLLRDPEHLSRLMLHRDSPLPSDDGAGLCLLGNCRQLELLHLQQVSIPDEGLSFLHNCAKLRTLNLIDCVGLDDEDLNVIARIDSLHELRLYGTEITDATIRRIARLPNLKQLAINRSLISDVGLKYIGQMSDLKELSLSGTRVSDRDLVHLAGLADLEELNLTSTTVTEEGATRIEDELMGRCVVRN